MQAFKAEDSKQIEQASGEKRRPTGGGSGKELLDRLVEESAPATGMADPECGESEADEQIKCPAD